MIRFFSNLFFSCSVCVRYITGQGGRGEFYIICAVCET